MPVLTRFARPAPFGAARSRLARLGSWRTRHPAAARAARRTATVPAAVLVLGALLLPHTVAALRPDRFARVPAEAIVGAVVLLALPRRARRAVAGPAGVLLGR